MEPAVRLSIVLQSHLSDTMGNWKPQNCKGESGIL
jgi:hypothetical protein